MKLALKETLQNLFDRLHIKRIVRYLSGFVAFSVFLFLIRYFFGKDYAVFEVVARFVG